MGRDGAGSSSAAKAKVASGTHRPFARAVEESIAGAPGAFSATHDKVLVIDAYHAFAATPEGKALNFSLAEFKGALVVANRARKLSLVKINLVEALSGTPEGRARLAASVVDSMGGHRGIPYAVVRKK